MDEAQVRRRQAKGLLSACLSARKTLERLPRFCRQEYLTDKAVQDIDRAIELYLELEEKINE